MGNELNDSGEVELITCTMCGLRFDPTEQIACQGCPVQGGCQLICCPDCGFETVDPSRSRLARLAGFFLSRGSKSGSGRGALAENQGEGS